MLINENNDGEIYTVYADLFLMLFMMATLMMGTNTSFSQSIKQAAEDGQAEAIPFSLYVNHAGELFRDGRYRTVFTNEKIKEQLHAKNTTRVMLHSPGDLSISVYGEVQGLLESIGVTEVSYIIEGKSHDEGTN